MSWLSLWTNEEEATLKELWNAGLPARDISKRLGRTNGAIYRRVINNRKVDPVGFPMRYTERAAPKKVKKLYGEESLKEANNKFLKRLAKHHLPPTQAAAFIAALEAGSIAGLKSWGA